MCAAPVNAFAAAKKTGGWECPVCEIRNAAGAAKCAACETDNPDMAGSAIRFVFASPHNIVDQFEYVE